jgi:hypothetical protein
MSKAGTIQVGTVGDLLPSWRISLMARNLSANTLETYTSAVWVFADFATERDADRRWEHPPGAR